MKMRCAVILTAALFLCGPVTGTSIRLSAPCYSPGPGRPGRVVYSVTSPQICEVRLVEDGEWRLELEGFHPLVSPGKPMLPSKRLLFALPAGARVISAAVRGSDLAEVPGAHRIQPVPPIIPLDRFVPEDGRLERGLQEWKSNYGKTYGSELPYPAECGRLTGSGTFRKYSFASVSFCPFRYFPRSGMLQYFRKAEIVIDYSVPEPDDSESPPFREPLHDTQADERAARMFVNLEDVHKMYQPGPPPSPSKMRIPRKRFTRDYVIITAPELASAISSSDFLPWKEHLGYRVAVLTIDDERITGQPGIDLAERIRNFLRAHYLLWNMEYVLLVGDYQTVPMRYCYPDPSNHRFDPGDTSSGEVPTDAYYADLSLPDNESWDLDGDGYHGEYEEDSPDFLPEVYVGRIPTNNRARITYTLNKLVSFEQDTGSWKNSALIAGAFWYFENEDRNGLPAYDGATCMNAIETNLMEGWTVSRYSEQGGLVPSAYDWPALSWDAFTSDWREGEYSIVNWGAHGAQSRAARKVWSGDDGDGVPEYHEMGWPDFIGTDADLDDDHPSIYFAISCLTGYPEPYFGGRLGIDLLTEPSWGATVGSIGATRVAYGIVGWPASPGGAESICFEFNRHMIDGPAGPERVGAALLNAKCYCNVNFPMEHFAENLNQFTFNLYGDPSLIREGVDTP